MVTFRNNNRRNSFRRNDRNFKPIALDKNKLPNNFGSKDGFNRKNNYRSSQNASKFFEKYSNLAREALSSGDKILSENYFQHADHYKRVMNENELFKKSKEDKSNEAPELKIEKISDENKNIKNSEDIENFDNKN